MTRKERAMELFSEGYNCSQAVLASFCDELNIDFETAVKLASSFGGGMGRMREICGAVSGMFMAAGLIYGYSDPKDNIQKKEHYERIQYLASKFKDEVGSIVCRDLLGLDKGENTNSTPTPRTVEYYKKRPCKELVGIAADILNNYIENK